MKTSSSNFSLFYKTLRSRESDRKKSKIFDEGGPSQGEQLIYHGNRECWIVLNSKILNNKVINGDDRLRTQVNALKHGLQCYGPISAKLLDCRKNEGKAKNSVFHGHVKHSNGTTYVLEWAAIDRKTIVLLKFGSHENFSFRDTPLSPKEITKWRKRPSSETIRKRCEKKQGEAANKLDKVMMPKSKQC